MPWEVKKSGKEYCVYKKGASSPIKGGCHPSHDSAVKHLRALYANVENGAEMRTPMLSKKDRDKLSEDVFADPANQLFPVQNQSDATETANLLSKISAPLMAPIKERLSSIAKTKGWTLPASFAVETEPTTGDLVAEPVEFEIGDDSFEDGDFVIYPNRKLFPAGWYESHNYGMSPEELAVAAYSATDVPLDLDHKDTVIKDEYIGHGRNFTAGWEGEQWVKRGDIAIHKMLNPLLKDETKMSTTWDRETKSLTKIALLLNPRIPDAELKPQMKEFAEFAKSKHTTNSGKEAIQRLHDYAVKGGATCDSSNAGMASKSEAKAIQAVHDQMVAEGAKCESEGGHTIWNYFNTNVSGDPAGEEAKLNKASTGAGGETPSPATANAELTEQVNPQVAAMQKQLDELGKKARRKDAEIAFSDLLREKKITPGLQGHFQSLYEQLLLDDERDAVSVQFGAKDEDKATRADLLSALFKGVIPHRHAEEMMKVKIGDGASVLMEETETSAADTRKRISDRAKKYNSATGKAAVAK